MKIIKKHENKYPRIMKVFSYKNMGVAKTRNKGIKLAKGTYICFIDNDDVLAGYKYALENDYNLVVQFDGMDILM